MDEACEPIPVLKDGQPGWIVGYCDTISAGGFADIEMVDGRSKFMTRISRSIRAALPPHPRDISPNGPLLIACVVLGAFVLGFSGYGAFVVIKGLLS